MTNLNTLALLVRDDVTTIATHFPGDSKCYLFKAPRRLTRTLAPGDHVVVHCSTGFRVVCVSEIHDEPEIDTDSKINFAWAFQKVETLPLQEQEEIEQAIVSKLKTERKRAQRHQALAAMGLNNPDELLAGITGPAKE